jgi:tetratricopeptide (TPR) repeat protein
MTYHRAVRAALILCLVGCAARPGPSVDALLAKHGVEGARSELEFRIASHPDDLDARRGLARLDQQHGRPASAIRHLLVVEKAGGPVGTRWTGEDRRRLAHLLVRRAWHRAARLAPSAVDDLEHAGRLGATIDPALQLRADQGLALAEMRHAASAVRARGIERMATLLPRIAPDLTTAQAARERLGAIAWRFGAKRATLEILEAWQADGGTAPAAVARLARARRWWSVPGATKFDADLRDANIGGGIVAPPPPDPVTDHCLPEAAAPTDACSPIAAIDAPGWELDLIRASRRWAPTRDPAGAAAWVIVTLRAALRGDDGALGGGAWLALLRPRVDPTTADHVLGWARPTLLRAAGRRDDAEAAVRGLAASPEGMAPGPALVVAAEAILAGLPAATVRDVLDAVEPGPDRDALAALIEPRTIDAAPPPPDVLGAATAARFGGDAGAYAGIARAYAQDPALAARQLDDLIDSRVDEAEGAAAAAFVMDGLGDLARARALWQRAVDASPEMTYVLELGLATARAGDDPAALIHFTSAAAASGDAAPVLVAGARALLDGGRPLAAIELAREAIDLAGPDAIGDALAVGADASSAAGRDDQAAELRRRRDALITPAPSDPDDPTDATAAVAAYPKRAKATGVAALVVAARWNPRDVATRALLARLPDDDPRATRARAELAALAANPSVPLELARRALAALRSAR